MARNVEMVSFIFRERVKEAVESTVASASVFSRPVIRSEVVITPIFLPSAPGAVPVILVVWAERRNGVSKRRNNKKVFIQVGLLIGCWMLDHEFYEYNDLNI